MNKQVKLTNLNIRRDILLNRQTELSNTMNTLVGPLHDSINDDIIFTRVNIYAVRNQERFARNRIFWERVGPNAHRGSGQFRTVLGNYLEARDNYLLNFPDQPADMAIRNRETFDTTEELLITEIKTEYASLFSNMNTIRDELTKIEDAILEIKP